MRIIASKLRSTSSSVVAHEETLMRIAARPCHTVPPHQQVPSAWIASITRRVVSSSPKETSAWLSTTSFSISYPAARNPSAKRDAWRQHLSIRSASPALPRERSADQISTPRADARPRARRRSRCRKARLATCGRRSPRNRLRRSLQSNGQVAGWPPPTIRKLRRRASKRPRREPPRKSPSPDRRPPCLHCPPECKRWLRGKDRAAHLRAYALDRQRARARHALSRDREARGP